MTTTRLYVFGDSIAFGQLVSPHLNWVTRLAYWLDSERDSCLLVQNAGVNGNTTRQALERFHFDVISHSPKFVIVQFGLNDCNRWLTDNGLPRVSLTSYLSNIDEIVARAYSAGVEHVFVNTNHPTAKADQPGSPEPGDYQRASRHYNAALRTSLAGSADYNRRLTLVDIEQSWDQRLSDGEANLYELLLPDGIHLSELGHQWYFEVVRNCLLTQGIA